MTKDEAISFYKLLVHSYMFEKIKRIWLTNNQGTNVWKLDIAYFDGTFKILELN